MTRTHRYTVTSRWTGNLGSGASAYAAYSRDHELSIAGKAWRIDDAIALYHRAGELCLIARSVNFPVEHEPQVMASA